METAIYLAYAAKCKEAIVVGRAKGLSGRDLIRFQSEYIREEEKTLRAEDALNTEYEGDLSTMPYHEKIAFFG
jgi:hypothetical protein